jgi:hypothetical protein
MSPWLRDGIGWMFESTKKFACVVESFSFLGCRSAIHM